ncbi:sulfatase [Candidatus Binatia bacterium]|nr:sulfatase [Candidatus Binatia bacterium]
MKKWIVVVVIVLVTAVFLWTRSGPRVREGAAVLDTSVYKDPAKDAQPVSDVVKPTGTAPSRLPNVVVIMADDLGYGDLGAYGNTVLRTPNIDRLAQGGMRFTDFYASHSNCSPSRAGMLTGRYPLRSGINFPIQPGDDSLIKRANRLVGEWAADLGTSDMVQTAESATPGLPLSEITIAEALRLAGYATALVGKWHLGDFRVFPEYHPSKHGFDFYAGVPYSNDNFPYQYWKNYSVVEEDLGLRQGGVTAALTRDAIEFIETNKTRPFFLYLAHKNVHTPLVPAVEFEGKSAAGPYGDSVEELDASVGEVMRALASRGLLEETFVFFTSDNGPWHLGNPGMLRGRKGQPMEGGQRVPAIAHWPGQIPTGAVTGAPAMNIDLFPTILRLAGLDLPRDRIIDGRDIWGLLSGRETASPHEALFFFNANVIDGARSGPWKYYRWVNLYTWPVPLDKVNTVAGRSAHRYTYTDPQTGQTAHLITHDPLLFDVRADSNESYNVIARHPENASRIRATIEHWERDFFANPRGWKQ